MKKHGIALAVIILVAFASCANPFSGGATARFAIFVPEARSSAKLVTAGTAALKITVSAPDMAVPLVREQEAQTGLTSFEISGIPHGLARTFRVETLDGAGNALTQAEVSADVLAPTISLSFVLAPDRFDASFGELSGASARASFSDLTPGGVRFVSFDASPSMALGTAYHVRARESAAPFSAAWCAIADGDGRAVTPLFSFDDGIVFAPEPGRGYTLAFATAADCASQKWELELRRAFFVSHDSAGATPDGSATNPFRLISDAPTTEQYASVFIDAKGSHVFSGTEIPTAISSHDLAWYGGFTFTDGEWLVAGDAVKARIGESSAVSECVRTTTGNSSLWLDGLEIGAFAASAARCVWITAPTENFSMRDCSITGVLTDASGSAVTVQTGLQVLVERCAVSAGHSATVSSGAHYALSLQGPLAHCIVRDNAISGGAWTGTGGVFTALHVYAAESVAIYRNRIFGGTFELSATGSPTISAVTANALSASLRPFWLANNLISTGIVSGGDASSDPVLRGVQVTGMMNLSIVGNTFDLGFLPSGLGTSTECGGIDWLSSATSGIISGNLFLNYTTTNAAKGYGILLNDTTPDSAFIISRNAFTSFRDADARREEIDRSYTIEASPLMSDERLWIANLRYDPASAPVPAASIDDTASPRWAAYADVPSLADKGVATGDSWAAQLPEELRYDLAGRYRGTGWEPGAFDRSASR